MADVKLLSWNIYKFGLHLVNNTTRLNVVLNLVNPPGGPKYDLFVVIEPQICNGAVGTLATGSGVKATKKLRAALHGQSGVNWQVVPPVVLAKSDKREALAIFFNAGKLTLKGPVDDAKIVKPTWKNAKTKGPSGTWRGKCEFVNSAGTKLAFPGGPERRPYLATFEIGGQRFSIIAHHSPKPNYKGTTAPARNKNARDGTKKLGEIKELQTANRTHPVIVVGDFNCCNPGHPSGVGCGQKPIDQDSDAKTALTGIGFTSHVSGGSSLKKATAATATAYTKHAFDYLLTAGGGGKSATVANAKVLGVGDLTTGFSAAHNKTKFRPIFKRIRVTKSAGVSDHLPVSANIKI
ncbi:MAG: hypothetical protein ACKV2U_17280 [Bryobacteraceae bacterium]